MEENKCCCCGERKKERSPAEYKDLVNRLNRIEGQIRGIKKMVERSAYCPDILIQVANGRSDVDRDAIERVAFFNGEYIPISGSSIKVHPDGGAYADSSNADLDT